MTMILQEDQEEDWMEVDDEEDFYVHEDNNEFFILVDSFVATISTHAALALEEMRKTIFLGRKTWLSNDLQRDSFL